MWGTCCSLLVRESSEDSQIQHCNLLSTTFHNQSEDILKAAKIQYYYLMTTPFHNLSFFSLFK